MGNKKWFIFLHIVISALVAIMMNVHKAVGFDAVPEYRHGRRDLPIQETIDKIDAEYSSDFLQYQLLKPQDQLMPASSSTESLRRWLTGHDVYQFSVGSLSNKNFLVEQRLRLTRPLAGPVEFRLTWFEESDWDENQKDFYWELRHQWHQPWKFFLFGNVAYEKSENDVGFGAEVGANGRSLWRASLMLPDFQRNQRSSDGTKWHRPPQVWSVTGHHLTKDDHVRYYARYEPPSILLNHTDDAQNEFEKMTLGLAARQSLNAHVWHYQIHFDTKKELNRGISNPDPQTEYQSQRTWLTIHRSFDLYERFLSAGLAAHYRVFNKNSLRASFQDLVPNLWIYSHAHEHSDWSHQYAAGVDATFHALKNPDQLLSDNDRQSLEGRLNFKYIFNFENRGSLSFLLSADIDEMGSSRTWEGGAAQMDLLF